MTTSNIPPAPAPDPSRPTIRAGGSVSGDLLCPRCGAFYKPPEACAACGYPNPPTRPPIRYAVFGFIGRVIKKLLLVVVLVALAWWAVQPSGGEPRYRQWWRDGVKPVLEKLGFIRIDCPDCHATGRITCPQCAGRGSMPWKREEMCQQCAGSGQYAKRMSDTKATCPFCKGTGKRVVEVTTTCTTCEGKGQLTCPRCEGSGKTTAGAKKP